MPAPEPLAVVGPEGSLVLPADLRQRHGLEPGVTLQVVERPDGVLELHRRGAAAAQSVPPDFWTRWLEEARSDAGEAEPRDHGAPSSPS